MRPQKTHQRPSGREPGLRVWFVVGTRRSLYRLEREANGTQQVGRHHACNQNAPFENAKVQRWHTAEAMRQSRYWECHSNVEHKAGATQVTVAPSPCSPTQHTPSTAHHVSNRQPNYGWRYKVHQSAHAHATGASLCRQINTLTHTQIHTPLPDADATGTRQQVQGTTCLGSDIAAPPRQWEGGPGSLRASRHRCVPAGGTRPRRGQCAGTQCSTTAPGSARGRV